MQKLPQSFGRRKARKLRPLAQKAYENLDSVKLRLEEDLFPFSPREVWLEIGFGGGEHFLAQLMQNPEVAMIGCEPFINGVASLLKGLLPEDRERVRIWAEDVRHLLGELPREYLSRVFILFPDPWPKKRHHHRRLVSQTFLSQLLPCLKEEGTVHVASDDPLYVEHIQDVLFACPELTLEEGPSSANPLTWGVRPQGWPPTRYEKKALAVGKPCAYMVFKKNSSKQ